MRTSSPENTSPASALSPLVTGCGALHTPQIQDPLRPSAWEALDAAIEVGSTAFDTAAVYGKGASEVELGRWIRSRKIRDRVMVITKGGHPSRAHPSRVHARFLQEDLHGSLRRLDTDYVDLYLLHRDDPSIPVGTIMSTLHAFVQEGKVRAVGASNWSYTRIQEANAYAKARGLTPLTASSPHFSLAEMHMPPWPGCLTITGEREAPARSFYAKTQIPVLAWSPLAGGFLAGHAPQDEAHARAYQSADNAKRRERATFLAQEYGVTLAHIALAYIFEQPFRTHPVVSATTRVHELLPCRVQLSAAERDWLDLKTSELDGAV